MAVTNHKLGFSYFNNKSDFTSVLQTQLTNDIVFVADTKEVYTHGTFFGIRAVTLNYDSATARIQLKDGDAVISEVDATPFLKDGMIDNVELITTPEGSSAVLSVNETNYPIVELDANQFNSTSWNENGTDYSAVVIPTLDENKAYYITNVSDYDSYVFENSGEFILKFDNNPRIFGNRSEFGTHTWANSWIDIPINIEIQDDNYTYYYGDSVYYDNATPLTSATETTGSVSNSNYPTLPYLKFTFNIVKESESGTPIPSHQVVRVSVADLVDAYDGANVYLSSNYANAASYSEPAVADSVDVAVGKLTKGVSDAQTQLMWNEYAGA